MTKPPTYGQVIREARERAGMKQKDLAAKIGVSRAYLCQVERGSKGPFSKSRGASISLELRIPWEQLRDAEDRWFEEHKDER